MNIRCILVCHVVITKGDQLFADFIGTPNSLIFYSYKDGMQCVIILFIENL